jgi:uncharacterized membrane protein
MTIAIALHVLAAVIWVGGMFFAHMFQRPAAARQEPLQRLTLWRHTFTGFFPWVWGSIVVLLATGYWMLFAVHGGFGGAGIHIHIMHATGWIMILLFCHLYFAPYRRLRRALDGGDLAAAAKQLGQIRRIVGINMLLGLATAAIGASGKYWGAL